MLQFIPVVSNLSQVANARVFLVGAGALGCEYMKQFALAGLGCSEDEGGRGLVTVTDMVRGVRQD